MSRIYRGNSLSLGNTPFARVNRSTVGAQAAVLAKAEGRNPACSVKCRGGANVNRNAEKFAILKAAVGGI